MVTIPTVSVVVPNYNHAPYLRKRVESILAQTYQDFELILLDDCSTDNSREVLKSYRDNPKVRIEFNDKNTGTPFKQWNKGVQMARGKYIWIAESDDYADSRFLERMVSILDERTETTFAYCRSWDIREDDQPRGFVDVYLEAWDANHWKADFLVDGLEEVRRFFVVAVTVPNASSVLFRKDAYERVGGADESFRVSADYKLWAAMALEGKIAYSGEPLNYFRTHSENARTRTEAGGLGLAECISVMLQLVTQVAELGTVPERAKKVFERPPVEMDAHERIRATIEAMSYIANWNLRYNRHVPVDAVRSRFGEWRLALYEKEFVFASPSRWRFFLYKCDFYRYYFPVMSWQWRAAGLIRLVGATALGYRRRDQPQHALAQVTRFLRALRQRE
jgi:glycosyltransferase involved in cell wall biosynthesis